MLHDFGRRARGILRLVSLDPPTWVCGLLAAAVLATADRALGADCGAVVSTCIDSEVVWPTAGRTKFFSIASASPLAVGSFGTGLTFSLLHAPIVLRTSAQGPAGSVAIPAIGTQLVASALVGFGVTPKLELDLAIAGSLQGGSGATRATAGTTTSVPFESLRDTRIGASYAMSRIDDRLDAEGVGAAFRVDCSIPTGDRNNFGGDRGVVVMPALTLEERLSRFAFGAVLGSRIRATSSLLGRRVGNQGVLGLGLATAIDAREWFAFTAEVLSLPTWVDEGTSPMEWLVGVRWAQLWGGALIVHAGGGGSFRGGAAAQLTEAAWRAVLDIRIVPPAPTSERH